MNTKYIRHSLFALVFFNIVYSNLYAGGEPTLINSSRERTEQLIKLLKSPESKYVMVSSHRGDWRNAPENSILGIKNCIKMGVDIVEIDVRMTKDSVPILMHDADLDRTTSGTGKVSEWTYDSLQTLHLRNGQLRITQYKIPTLEEAMLAAKGKILVNLDKSVKYMDKVYDVLVKTGTTDQAIFKGDKGLNYLRTRYGSLLDKIIYMPVVPENQPHLARYVNDFTNDYKPLAFEFVFSSDQSPVFPIIKKVKGENCRVWVNTLWQSLCGTHDDDRAIDDPDGTWGWVIKHGANIIQTDRPALLIQYLKNRKLHNLK